MAISRISAQRCLLLAQAPWGRGRCPGRRRRAGSVLQTCQGFPQIAEVHWQLLGLAALFCSVA